MFTVNIIVRGCAQPIQLYFKDHEAAMRAFDFVKGEEYLADDADLRDQFSQRVNLDNAVIEYVNLVDVEQTLSAQVEMNMCQARAQAEASMKAQADPKLRFAGQMRDLAGSSAPLVRG